jgi:ketosteroid isomerase-like protein
LKLTTDERGLTMASGMRDDRTRRAVLLGGGALGVIAARRLFAAALLLKLRRDVRALNAGNYRPLLAGYAEDAVLMFNDGTHRWAGEHRGKAAIERFFQDFVAAGIEGEVVDAFFAGPPWRLTLAIRFDDEAHAPDGERIYGNRTFLLARARWGKIVYQQDFYEDTERIGELDARLRELGTAPVSVGSAA